MDELSTTYLDQPELARLQLQSRGLLSVKSEGLDAKRLMLRARSDFFWCWANDGVGLMQFLDAQPHVEVSSAAPTRSRMTSPQNGVVGTMKGAWSAVLILVRLKWATTAHGP